jgi:hypothetical protein
MNRREKREAIRRADLNLRRRIGASFEDAQLSSQWWALVYHSELTWDEAMAMRPALRRLRRLWAQRRRERLSRHSSDLPDFLRAS